MLVVADSSPFIAIINIGHLDVLPRLFTGVTIPPAVADELADVKRPQAVQNFISTPPAWLDIRKPSRIEYIPGLHAGECEAISLAGELNAELLLIDESHGWQAALARHIPTTRTAALLRLAADRGLLDLKEAFDRLKATNFRVPHDLLDCLLREHEALRRRADLP